MNMARKPSSKDRATRIKEFTTQDLIWLWSVNGESLTRDKRLVPYMRLEFQNLMKLPFWALYSSSITECFLASSSIGKFDFLGSFSKLEFQRFQNYCELVNI